MRIEYLSYFIEVSRCKSINKASKNLHLTQANLSKMIKRIEQYFDTELFERTNRGVTLTEHGKQVLEWAKHTMNEQMHLFQTFADENRSLQNTQGILKILCPANIAGDSNTTVIDKFTCEFPNINIIYQEMGISEIINHVRENKKYIGIIMLIDSLYNKMITDEFCYFPLRELKFVVYSHKDSRFAKQFFKSVSLKELCKELLIIYKPTGNSSSPIEDIFSQFGLDNIRLSSVSNLFTFNNILQKGQHITIGAARQAKFLPIELENLIATPIRDKINCQVGILIHNENKDSMMIQQLIKYYNESK